jgi:hypothetical protein
MKPNVDDLDPLEPGCPHCGAMTAHPNSSRPVAPAGKSKKLELHHVVNRPDGSFAYDLFVTLMGNKDVAVSWDRLTDKAQKVWMGVARGVERRTIGALLAERARFEQESKR